MEQELEALKVSVP